MFNMFSGGALSRFSIFALGIMPYISASIIMQLMTVVSPTLEALKKEGESGGARSRSTRATARWAWRCSRAMGIAIALESQRGLVIDPGLMFRIVTMITLTTGTMFLMWLGEQITERGIGNGISIIIFAGIAAGLPQAIAGTLELVRTGAFSILIAAVHLRAGAAVTAFVVFVERGQRKILVNYAKRQVGRKIYGGQTSHLPLKLNMSGRDPADLRVEPIILFPATLVGWFGASEGFTWLRNVAGDPVSGPADLRDALCVRDHLLLLLLHGARVQSQGDGGQPEEERRLRARHPAGRADRALHRTHHDAAHADWVDLRDAGVPAAGVPDRVEERAVLFRRHVAAHHRGGDDGLHGAGAGLRDVAPVRKPAQEGQFQRGMFPTR